jgi:hypothetical protein
MKFLVFFTLLFFSFNGFSQHAKGTRAQDDSLAKNFTPSPGKAIVYIIRPSIMAAAIEMRLDCDSFFVGWINPKTYLFTVLDSGDHTFIAKSENKSTLKIHLDGGQKYYLEQDAKMGIMYARTKLRIITPEEGIKYLSKYLISRQNNYPLFTYSTNVVEPTFENQ